MQSARHAISPPPPETFGRENRATVQQLLLWERANLTSHQRFLYFCWWRGRVELELREGGSVLPPFCFHREGTSTTMQIFLLTLITAVLGSQLIPVGELGTLNPAHLTGAGGGGTPQISLARDGSDLAAAFTGIRGRQSGIYWRRFSSDTQNWSEAVQVNPKASSSGYSPFLSIDKKGNSHCVWLSRRNRGVYEVYHSRLSKGEGQHWSQPQLLTTGGRAIPPRLMEDAFGNLLVYFWNMKADAPKGRIYAFSSRDGGLTWGATNPNFSDQEKAGRVQAAQGVRLPGGGLGLAWTDGSPGAPSLVFNRTEDGGESWLARPAVIPGTAGQAINHPQILVAGPTIHVAWTFGNVRPGSGSRAEAWTSHSQDAGLSWSEARKVYQTENGQISLNLVQAGENVGWIGIEKLPSRTQPEGPPGGRLIEVLFFQAGQPLSDPVVKEIYASTDHELSDVRVVPSPQRVMVLLSETHPFEPSRIMSFIREEGDFHSGPIIQANAPGTEVRMPLADFDHQEGILTVLFHQMKRATTIEPQPSPPTLFWQRYRVDSVR